MVNQQTPSMSIGPQGFHSEPFRAPLMVYTVSFHMHCAEHLRIYHEQAFFLDISKKLMADPEKIQAIFPKTHTRRRGVDGIEFFRLKTSTIFRGRFRGLSNLETHHLKLFHFKKQLLFIH